MPALLFVLDSFLAVSVSSEWEENASFFIHSVELTTTPSALHLTQNREVDRKQNFNVL